MKYNYTFLNNRDFLGCMFLENDQTAVEIAQKCGATELVNEHTKTKYKKCLGCGKWEKTDDLKNGLCWNCDYQQRIQEFIDFVDGEFAQAQTENKMDELYKEHFTITFKDLTLTLDFAAEEYNGISYYLEELIKELKQLA